MDFAIRQAVPDDYDEVHNLVCSELGFITESFRDIGINRMQQSNYIIFVAEAGGKIIALLGLNRGTAMEIGCYYYRIIAMAVSPLFLGQNIGALLFQHAERFAKEHGTSIVCPSGGLRSAAHRFMETTII